MPRHRSARWCQAGRVTVPTLPFHDGHTIPQLGFGVFRVEPGQTERIVTDALEVGYRHIDTAALYENEEGVGAAIAHSGIPRDELFVTTKLANSDQGEAATLAAIDRSLDKLGLESVDLYLIHWPLPERDLYVETWRTFERIRAEGKATSIGVSNFRIQDLDRLAAETDTVPVINQIELHPLLTQTALRGYHDAHDIRTESWGPLGHARVDFFSEGPLGAIAAAHGKTPAQVVLRWHIQSGLVVIPKSNHRERMQENFEIFDFELSADEVAAIDGMNRDQRAGKDPDTVN
jgi:2,5-diketo-D-gluconate reductase A